MRNTVIRFVLLLVSAYILLLTAPLLRSIPPLPATIAATVIFTGISVALIVLGARMNLPGVVEVAAMVVVGGLWLTLRRLSAGGAVNQLAVGPAVSVMFLLLCLLIGRLISRIIREANILVPVCIVAAAADIFTVYWGPTGKFLAQAPQVVAALSVQIPEVGSATGPEGVAGLRFITMGLGDFIFLAVFLRAAARLGFNLARTGWIIAILLAAGLTTLFFVPAAAPLLPFIAAGFLIANWREFHLSREEKWNLLWAAAVVGVIVVAMVLLVKLS